MLTLFRDLAEFSYPAADKTNIDRLYLNCFGILALALHFNMSVKLALATTIPFLEDSAKREKNRIHF